MHRLIRLRNVKLITGLSRTSIYRFMSEGTFPRHVPLAGRTVAWVESEIEAWVQQKLDARDDPAVRAERSNRMQAPTRARRAKRIAKRARAAVESLEEAALASNSIKDSLAPARSTKKGRDQ